MQAVLMSQPGDASVLQLGTTSQPDLLPGEVLLAVHAAGVNRADILQRQGLYPPPPGASTILGLEAGEIFGKVVLTVDPATRSR
jgi:NADPH2:quinone reductase